MQKTVDAQPRATKTDSFGANPLAQLSVSFALGILAALSFEVSPKPVIFGSAICSVIAVLSLLRKRQRVMPLVLTLAIGLLGASLAAVEKFQVPGDQIKRLIEAGVVRVGEPVELTGVLERDPEIAPERLYFQLRVHTIRSRVIEPLYEPADTEERTASGVVMLLAAIRSQSTKREFDELDLRYGARLRVVTRLERADSYRNPGVSSFTEYLDRKGYDASGFVKSPLLIERLDNERVFLPLAWLYEWRGRLQTEIDARFSAETAGVLDAAMLGNRYKLSPSTAERFRDGGTFHALVISGLHITFLGGVVFLIARRFTRSRVLQFLLSAGVLWSYALAVGAESSVARAALMFTVIVFAPLVYRRAASLNVLGCAALVLLAWRPSDLLDPSFQLTFVSVIALVIFSLPCWKRWQPSARGAVRQTPYPSRARPGSAGFAKRSFGADVSELNSNARNTVQTF